MLDTLNVPLLLSVAEASKEKEVEDEVKKMNKETIVQAPGKFGMPI